MDYRGEMTLTDATVRMWPTPTAFDANTPANISAEARERQLRRGDPNGTRRTSSGSLAKEVLWPTPVANDDNKTPEAHLAMKERMGGNRTAITSLNVITKLWPTPQAADGHKIGSMTPETAQRQAAASHQEMLMGAAVLGPTPCARDAKSKPGPNAQMETLPSTASHQHETTPTGGNNGSAKVDLNPWFVASLMGLPQDWLTHSTSAVTDLCRKQQQQQSGNSLSVAGGSYD
jgi:hypothetical protein